MARCLVLTGFGINCEQESLAALTLAGARSAEIVHVAEILAGDRRIRDYQFVVFPGGFLDGDDLGSAKVQVNRFRFSQVHGSRRRLADDLLEFVDRGNIALGICNGFQFMTKAGLLPGARGAAGFVQTATLMSNDSGRFEDRWVSLAVNPASPCIFTRGLDRLYLPVRHGEGKFFCGCETLSAVKKANLDVLCYTDGSGRPTTAYPANPNGSLDAIAGVCDATGRLFGLMPHPEAFVFPVNHPRWTRERVGEPDGLKIFKNALDYLKQG